MLKAVPRPEEDIQVYDWISNQQFIGIAENFARIQILLTLFDGLPEKWIQFIRAYGSPEERLRDIPFLEELKKRMEADPEIVQDMRRIVGEVSNLFARRSGNA